ncbi:MAG: hypothetical protein ACXVRZ_14600 [Gaiellaceae bacterium]
MRRHRPLVDVLLAASVTALVAVPAAAAAKPRGFTPAVLAGTWAGTWSNQTFNTSGTLALRISVKGSALRFTTTITGNTFGCTAPGPQTFTLPAGSGSNHWTPKGFPISNPSAAFGTMNIRYAYPAGTLSGSGKDPACAPGISWTLDGLFTAKQFNATARITLPGGGSATTVVSLAKK